MMKLHECDQKVDAIVLPLLIRDKPEGKWVHVRDGGIIPASLYTFYAQCGYFSFGYSPKMLKDDEHLLFTLLSNVCDGMAYNFNEAAQSVAAITEAATKTYNPIKRHRKEKYDYDPNSHDKQSKSFKDLTLALTGILDQFAEVVAIVFNNHAPGTEAGRSQFSGFHKEFFKRPAPASTSTIVTPLAHFSEALHKRLSPILICVGDEEDWLDVLYLYRNKLAHIGIGMFMPMSFADPSADRFYAFMPKKWPYHVQSRIQPYQEMPQQPLRTLMETWGDILSHCDIVDFSSGALRKVKELIQEGMDVMNQGYAQMKGLSFNQSALNSVNKNTKTYKFKSFK